MTHPPPGFQRFAWNGLALLLPEDWNLHFHRGDRRVGALVFVDLVAPRLELRWQTPHRLWPLDWFQKSRTTTEPCGSAAGPTDPQSKLKDSYPKNDFSPSPAAARKLSRTLSRLKKRTGTQVTSLAGWTQLQHDDTLTLLRVHGHLVIELHWPRNPQHIETIATDFAACALLAANTTDRYWNVYGAAGLVSANLSLADISMLPGATRLEFGTRWQRQHLTLGSFSLADRLLRPSSPAEEPLTLSQWAKKNVPFLQKHPNAQWTEIPTETLCTLTTRRLLRRQRHTLTFRLDWPTNRITWSHQVTV